MADGGVLHLSHSLMIIGSLFVFSPHDPNFFSSPSELFIWEWHFCYDVTSLHPTRHCFATLSPLSKWDASIHAFLTRAEGCARTSVCMCTAYSCACEQCLFVKEKNWWEGPKSCLDSAECAILDTLKVLFGWFLPCSSPCECECVCMNVEPVTHDIRTSQPPVSQTILTSSPWIRSFSACPRKIIPPYVTSSWIVTGQIAVCWKLREKDELLVNKTCPI